MPAAYLLAVDAVTSGNHVGTGVGFVIAALGQEQVLQPAFMPGSSRQVALILGAACALKSVAHLVHEGDHIEVQLCTDPDLLLKSMDPRLSEALMALDEQIEAINDAGGQIGFGKADAREAPCLATATQQAALGLLCNAAAAQA